jgi:hypothetical protein
VAFTSIKRRSNTPGEGLTCATYVVEVMETLGFTPFDKDGWIPTDEDAAWQKRVIEFYRQRYPEWADHFEAEKANIGGPRYRPDHVAAAGRPPIWPLTQQQANELARRVVESYNAVRG